MIDHQLAQSSVLRQTFFSRFLAHTQSPLDLLPLLERVFPLCHDLVAALQQLDELKACLDSFRPLPPQQIQQLQAVWDIEYIYESNRIEGNTLTLAETSLVIREGLTVAGKTINEHLEAINHQEAVWYLRAIVDGDVQVSESMIRALHELILKHHPQHHEQRERYRSVPVMITGTEFVPPQPWLVPKLMEELIQYYQQHSCLTSATAAALTTATTATTAATLHPVALAADMHAELVRIHPFIDGNGRTSRLLMNFILLRHGFPIANISGDKAKRLDYYAALNQSHLQQQPEPFRLLVAQYVRQQCFNYLAMLSSDMSDIGAAPKPSKGDYFFATVLSRTNT